MNLTNTRQPQSGFSLVEVTLALGVAAVALVAILGMLPVGVTSNQNTLAQTTAAGIAAGVAADLRGASGTTPSPRYQFVVPAAGDGTRTSTLFVGTDGSSTGAIDASAVPTLNPRFRVQVEFTPPAAASRAATTARLLLTWPALADPKVGTPKNYTGSFETVIALDRN